VIAMAIRKTLDEELGVEGIVQLDLFEPAQPASRRRRRRGFFCQGDGMKMKGN